ncbi:MAG: (deoxy)nucleoside triphosphate pyrophosphohydrolase [Ruminiclostridium sp.]|nr:(deoxy)nucleoside triphosphate pyrophosphohydrolase [Ruminiclostridium sp.]
MTEVVAALIWEGEQFLACQRPAHKARALLWEFVGGKVEPGETRQEALRRECREELGIELQVGELFMEVDHVYPDITIHLSLFHGEILEGEPQMLEHNDIRWVTTTEMDELTFCPADDEILARLRTYDRKADLERQKTREAAP